MTTAEAVLGGEERSSGSAGAREPGAMPATAADSFRLPETWNGHVVVLMVYRRPEQVAWLIGRLLEDGACVVLHVDRKALPMFDSLLPVWRSTPGVAVLPEPVVVNWAGFSQVRAALLGVQWARTHLPGLRYLHLMSGECLPLRPLPQIGTEIERAYPGQELMECRLRPGYEWRIQLYNILGEHPKNRSHWHNKAFKWVRDAQRRLPPRSNFRKDEIYFGSQWWTLRGTALEKMLGGVDIEAFCHRFRWTRCADEHFFQILFRRAGLEAAGNRRHDVFDVGAASPRYLDVDELHAARAAGLLFARKVTLEVAQAFLAAQVAQAIPER